MPNDRGNNDQQQPGTENTENGGSEREEQFNELSSLSLEERIAVADQIGIPVETVSGAAALGTVSGSDDAADGPAGEMEESMGEEPDR